MMKTRGSCLAAIGLCFALSGHAARAEPSVPAFYEAVQKIAPDGKLGQIVSRQQISTPVPGARAWLIAYISSDVAEHKTISTGLVVAPAGTPPAGGRAVSAWAHGTTGAAQNCGPSQVPNPAQELNEYFLVGGKSWTDYGLPSLEALIKDGYVVVGTDYQGQGGGGKHQYAVAATQAHDVINSIRAAGSLREAGAGKKAILYGWSQGGGAVIAAASEPDYLAKSGTASDGVDLVGVVALAPFDFAASTGGQTVDAASSEKMMGELAAAHSGNVFDFTHLAMALWGTKAAFPGLQLTDVFTEEGAKVLDDIFSNKCMHPSASTINYAYPSDYKALLNPQTKNSLAWVNALVQGSVAPVKPVAPVLIFWGTKDTTEPPIEGKLYQAQMCKLGGNVGRIQLPGEQTHFTTPGASAPLYLPWMKARLAGTAAPNACPQS